MVKLFSDAKRPVYIGLLPLESLVRSSAAYLDAVLPFAPLGFGTGHPPHSIIHAMRDDQAMMDAIQDDPVAAVRSKPTDNPQHRAEHLEAFGYFSDASMVGVGPVSKSAGLPNPVRTRDIDWLAADLQTRQAKTLAVGIDLIMADLRDAMSAPPRSSAEHKHDLVFLYEIPRTVRTDEPGAAWIMGAEAHRAALRAGETAVVLANYIHILRWDAKAHTAT